MTSIQEALKSIVPADAGVVCPYCGQRSKIVTGEVIYPHRKDLNFKKFHLCTPCNAYVGCHDRTGKPLGRLADPELRMMKVKAHAAFDPLWQRGCMTRSAAYSWLAGRLKVWLGGQPAHIGEFNVEMCKRTIVMCMNFRGKK